jgi:hypothetical protein
MDLYDQLAEINNAYAYEYDTHVRRYLNDRRDYIMSLINQINRDADVA